MNRNEQLKYIKKECPHVCDEWRQEIDKILERPSNDCRYDVLEGMLDFVISTSLLTHNITLEALQLDGGKKFQNIYKIEGKR